MRGSSACVLLNAQNRECNQKLGVCGAQFGDGFAELSRRRSRREDSNFCRPCCTRNHFRLQRRPAIW